MGVPRTDGKSLGLVSVRERTAQLAGMVDILTSPAIQGTRVTVRIPLSQLPQRLAEAHADPDRR